MKHFVRAACVCAIATSSVGSSAASPAGAALAPANVGPASWHEASVVLSIGKTPEGRPDIRLDRLDFPQDLRESAALRKHLIRVLTREVRRVEWGAGRENRIEYRYSVTQLSLEQKGDVLHVTCTAVGKLPGGKTARSHLSFGGAPRDRYKLLKKVLEIVARGVISRLAELERARRGLTR